MSWTDMLSLVVLVHIGLMWLMGCLMFVLVGIEYKRVLKRRKEKEKAIEKILEALKQSKGAQSGTSPK